MKKINEYKHIVWDFNGTLINDLDIGIKIQEIMMTDRGIPVLTRQRYLETMDFPIRDWYEKIGYDISDYENLAQIWNDYYDEQVKICGLNAGARELLDSVKRRGIGQSIISASHTRPLFHLTEKLGIREYFDFIYGLDNQLAFGKAHLCERLVRDTGISGSDMLLIGDTTQDFLTAKTLGGDCALVACGHQSFSRLEATSADTFENLAALHRTLFS